MKLASPEQAEAAFYQAFEKADLAAMMSVWADDEEIICVHPGGPRLVGMEAVRESWRRIFASGPQLRFQRRELRAHTGRMMSVHNLYERITVSGQLRPHVVLATNIYLLGPSGWRMFMHHASPPPAEVLAAELPPGTVH